LAPAKSRREFKRPAGRAATTAWLDIRGRNRELRFKQTRPVRFKLSPTSAATRLEEYLAHPTLENMRGSHVDWKAEGIEPPNALSRLNAVRVLEVAGDLEIEPTYVAVSADGGIGICFKKNGLYGDIECFNTGEMWAIFSDRVNAAQTWQLDNTVPKISQALVTIDFKLNPDA
jgi:hypothetical protein